ncbi:Hypothetical predicted protein [Podarcis lilfordi]|uniref:Uncharacterized protein n=1 Tax=Podarcis lilfordi TaxID=74358 RepID=A0AA35JUP0_9SAUR|nr:Hypothetical predicted protein [Podarcis lilfordi]
MHAHISVSGNFNSAGPTSSSGPPAAVMSSVAWFSIASKLGLMVCLEQGQRKEVQWGWVAPGITTEGGDKTPGGTHCGACSVPKPCVTPGRDAVVWACTGSALPNGPPAASPQL